MKKIIMVDQDGVVCDGKYQTNQNISPVVNTISKDKNIVIVPNSDTPIERLVSNFKEMIFYTPSIVIGERGSVVLIDGKVFYPYGEGSEFESYKKELQKCFTLADVKVFIGNSATWVKNKKVFAPNSRIVLVDSMRRQSIGFYLLKTNKQGALFFDKDWFSFGCEIVKSVKLPNGVVFLTPDKNSAILIGSIDKITKTDGYLFLKSNYPDAAFYMIGNGDSDIIKRPEVVHCSVANGSKGLKEVSLFIAQSSTTKGLGECLSWILQN